MNGKLTNKIPPNKTTQHITKAFALGLLITPLIISPFVLDATLTIRFICLSLSFLVCFYFIYKDVTLIKVKINPILFFYCFYVAYTLLSFSWAISKSEAVFESCKALLGLSVFFMASYTLQLNPFLLFKILKISSVSFVLLSTLSAALQIQNVNKESLYLITGLNGHKNLYSSYLFLNLFFLIYSYLDSKKKVGKLLYGICIAISVAVLLFLRTKAVWLGAGIATLCFVLLYLIYKKYKIRKINLPLITIALLVMANLFFLRTLHPLIKSAINYNNEIINTAPQNKPKELDKERLILWEKTYGIIKKNPILGTGSGNWQIAFPNETLSGLWRAEDLNYTFQRPHNDFLWMLSESGIVGYNLFLTFLIIVFIYILKTINSLTIDREKQKLMIFCFAFIVGYFTISFFDFPKERMEHLIALNVLLALAYFYIKQNNSFKTFFKVSFNKTLRGVALLSFIFVLIVGTLRYKGEYFTRKMYVSAKTDYFTIIKMGEKAQSFVYKIDPTSVPINWFVGNAYASLQNYSKARECFLKAYALNPYNRNVLNDLGSSYAMTEDIDKAKFFYEEAARISPRFDDPKLNLAAIYIREQNYYKANIYLKALYHDSERRSNYQKIVANFINDTP